LGLFVARTGPEARRDHVDPGPSARPRLVPSCPIDRPIRRRVWLRSARPARPETTHKPLNLKHLQPTPSLASFATVLGTTVPSVPRDVGFVWAFLIPARCRWLPGRAARGGARLASIARFSTAAINRAGPVARLLAFDRIDKERARRQGLPG
jgi:hypothetical protein